MIYLVEDDSSIREVIVYTLNSTGLESMGFEKPSDFWKALEKEMPALVMLDVMLPEESGIEILQKLRANPKTEKMPIIMATAKTSEYDKINGLESGADDYIAKPFSPKILVARVEALLRRTNSANEKNLEYGGIVLNRSAHEVIIDGEKVDLSYKEFELLSYFMENKDIALSRERILNHVWDYDYFGDARTIDTHVKKLRSKMGEKGKYIKTIWGMGYKFEV